MRLGGALLLTVMGVDAERHFGLGVPGEVLDLLEVKALFKELRDIGVAELVRMRLEVECDLHAAVGRAEQARDVAGANGAALDILPERTEGALGEALPVLHGDHEGGLRLGLLQQQAILEQAADREDPSTGVGLQHLRYGSVQLVEDERLIVRDTDDVRLEVNPLRFKYSDYYDIERDNSYGDVWEVADFAPSESDIKMLEAIANSSETIVRFEGDSKHCDLTVKSTDKQSIKDVLNAYEFLK